jgi:hypothetical protein
MTNYGILAKVSRGWIRGRKRLGSSSRPHDETPEIMSSRLQAGPAAALHSLAQAVGITGAMALSALGKVIPHRS